VLTIQHDFTVGYNGVLHIHTLEEYRMYPEVMVIPMREELTRIGIKETRTAAEVVQAIAHPGTTMIVVNSICGCAAGKMRPAVRMALQQGTAKPDQSITVFAGQDRDATEKARNYFAPYPPSSPSIGLLRGGKLVYFMPRAEIETSDAPTIASKLLTAFEQHCSKTAAK
jgi:bacilliredoxin